MFVHPELRPISMYTYYSEVALQVILNSPPRSITNRVIEHLQINIHR